MSEAHKFRVRILKAIQSIKGLKYLEKLATEAEAYEKQETGKKQQRRGRHKTEEQNISPLGW